MPLDYLIPLLAGVVMIAVPGVLLVRAWRQRPVSAPASARPSRSYRSGLRQAYSLSRGRVLACLVASLYGAVAAGLAMATALPLGAAENALLATLFAPLVWAVGFVVLSTRARWRRDCLLTLAVATTLSAVALLPLVAG